MTSLNSKMINMGAESPSVNNLLDEDLSELTDLDLQTRREALLTFLKEKMNFHHASWETIQDYEDKVSPYVVEERAALSRRQQELEKDLVAFQEGDAQDFDQEHLDALEEASSLLKAKARRMTEVSHTVRVTQRGNRKDLATTVETVIEKGLQDIMVIDQELEKRRKKDEV